MVGLKLFIASYLVLFFLLSQSDTLFNTIIKHTTNTMKLTRCTFQGNPKRLTNWSCEVKAISRGVSELNAYTALLEPLRNFSVRFEVFKLYNGYRPFLPNITVYWCEFMAGRRRSPILKIAAQLLKNTSNFNTTCPYENYLIIRKVKYVPGYFPISAVVPGGKYKAIITVNDDTEVEPYIGQFLLYAEIDEFIQKRA